MRKIVSVICIVQLTAIFGFGQIIADHRVVDQYDDIPQRWIDSVKTKWAVVVGASHAEAYLNGCDSLEELDANYAWSKGSAGPLPNTNQYLRLDKWIWGDYQDPTGGWQDWSYNNSWWTSSSGVELMKENFHYCIDNGFDLFAIWFGWSYDAVWLAPSGSYDPVYHTRWGGGAPRWATTAHPGGWDQWGLDSGDEALTGNSLSMQDYIDTMEMYIQYVSDNDLDIKIVYSTGAVDNDQGDGTSCYGESGYQQYLKWEYIRNYVNTQGNDTYFIDYADILTYNDAGEQATTTWTDNSGTLQTFPVIHPENNLGTQSAHIGNVGALKLAKATWWLLARMAGWQGIDNPVKTSKGAEIPDSMIDIRFDGDIIVMNITEEYVNGQIAFYNITGSLVELIEAHQAYNSIHSSKLSEGVYFLVLSKNGKRIVNKLLVTRN